MSTFGWAIEQLKDKKRVARSGWNGKGMWLQLHPGVDVEHFGDGRVEKFRPYIEMKDAQDMYVPWLASQTDMLAEDWELVEGKAEPCSRG